MKYKRFATVFLVAAMIVTSLGMGTSAMAAPETGKKEDGGTKVSVVGSADIKGKDEVVYANLAANGSVDAVYVVNHFDLATGGQVEDYGSYDSVVNLTNSEPLNQTAEFVSFQANGGDYYYQGNMPSADLPWNFDIAYFLDGEELSAQELAGRDGALEVRIKSGQNSNAAPTFYENYMLQITVTLDGEKCSNIDAPDATLANAGKNRVIAYTVMPNKDADFVLKADVREFEMAGIDISAMPFSMNIEMPDTEEQFEDIEKLPEGISELNDGVEKLVDGTREMRDGIKQLSSGSSSIQSGLSKLRGNSGQLLSASSQIKGALSQIVSSLEGAGVKNIDLSQMAELPDGLSALAGGIRELSKGLSQLKEGFTPAYAALDNAIGSIPEASVSQDQINALYAVVTDPAQQEALGSLVSNYAAAQTVKGTYAQVKPAFDAVGSTIDQMQPGLGETAGALDQIAEEMDGALGKLDGLSKLGELVDGLTQLSESYGQFHSGLGSYMDGVSTLASNYSTFNSGISSFDEGVDELNNGIGELYDGTSTLNEEVADMPDMIEEEIDKLKQEYMPADFDAVSFASPQNSDIEFVQFVIHTQGVSLPDETVEKTDEAEVELSFWDRLVLLFQGNES